MVGRHPKDSLQTSMKERALVEIFQIQEVQKHSVMKSSPVVCCRPFPLQAGTQQKPWKRPEERERRRWTKNTGCEELKHNTEASRPWQVLTEQGKYAKLRDPIRRFVSHWVPDISSSRITASVFITLVIYVITYLTERT